MDIKKLANFFKIEDDLREDTCRSGFSEQLIKAYNHKNYLVVNQDERDIREKNRENEIKDILFVKRDIRVKRIEKAANNLYLFEIETGTFNKNDVSTRCEVINKKGETIFASPMGSRFDPKSFLNYDEEKVDLEDKPIIVESCNKDRYWRFEIDEKVFAFMGGENFDGQTIFINRRGNIFIENIQIDDFDKNYINNMVENTRRFTYQAKEKTNKEILSMNEFELNKTYNIMTDNFNKHNHQYLEPGECVRYLEILDYLRIKTSGIESKPKVIKVRELDEEYDGENYQKKSELTIYEKDINDNEL